MKLSARCHALLGFAYVPPWAVNAGFVRGDVRTLVVDTGPTAQAAATIFGYAQAAAPGNALLAIDTERHLDHIAGNDLFRSRGVEVLGHPSIVRSDAELAADVAEYGACVTDAARRGDGEGRIPFLGTRIANPSTAVDRDMQLDLGGVKVSVLLLPGHTPANLAVWVPSDGVIYTGDTVVSDYRPNLASGGPAEWRLWLAALDRVESLGPQVVVPGHGRVLRDEDIAGEIDRVRVLLLRALDDEE
jgi:cyclase